VSRWALGEARAVLRALEAADGELVKVMANTSDPQVAGAAELAQKSTRTALRRARLVTKDLDLKNAEQPELLDELADANQGDAAS